MSVEAPELMKKVKLSDARARLRISQQRLSELAEVAKVTVSHAETGRPIRRMSAHAILEALNAERDKRGMRPLSLEQVDWIIYDK